MSENNGDVDRLRQMLGIEDEEQSAVEVPMPSFVGAAAMFDQFPELHEWLINGLLRRGETMNVVAASKKGKTFLVIYIALCIATGRAIFGQFSVRQGRVLMIDNELHAPTLAKRIRDVAYAMGIDRSEYEDTLMVQTLRGKVCDLFRMRPYFNALDPGAFDLIILDAWYRMIPAKESENDNAVVTQMLNAIDSYAERIGASFMIVHHASKGDQSGKAVTDMGSGAGAQSRAVDTHMVLRQHEEDDAAVVDAAVRSFKPIQPFCIQFAFPLWNPAPHLDPENLKKPTSRSRGNSGQKSKDAVEDKPEMSVDDFVAKYVSREPRQKKLVVALAEGDKLKNRDVDRFVTLAIHQRKLWSFTREKGGAVYLSTQEPSLTDLLPNGADVPPSPPCANPPTPPCGRQATQGAGEIAGVGITPDENPGLPKPKRVRRGKGAK